MNSLFESRFREMKHNRFTDKQVRAGFFAIWRVQKPVIYWKILWEVISTIMVYVPSTHNYTYSIVMSINEKWDKLSDEDQINIIAALSRMNKKGKIDRIFDQL